MRAAKTKAIQAAQALAESGGAMTRRPNPPGSFGGPVCEDAAPHLSPKRRRELIDFAASLAEQVERRVPPGFERCTLRRMVEILLDG